MSDKVASFEKLRLPVVGSEQLSQGAASGLGATANEPRHELLFKRQPQKLATSGGLDTVAVHGAHERFHGLSRLGISQQRTGAKALWHRSAYPHRLQKAIEHFSGQIFLKKLCLWLPAGSRYIEQTGQSQRGHFLRTSRNGVDYYSTPFVVGLKAIKHVAVVFNAQNGANMLRDEEREPINNKVSDPATVPVNPPRLVSSWTGCGLRLKGVALIYTLFFIINRFVRFHNSLGFAKGDEHEADLGFFGGLGAEIEGKRQGNARLRVNDGFTGSGDDPVPPVGFRLLAEGIAAAHAIQSEAKSRSRLLSHGHQSLRDFAMIASSIVLSWVNAKPRGVKRFASHACSVLSGTLQAIAAWLWERPATWRASFNLFFSSSDIIFHRIGAFSFIGFTDSTGRGALLRSTATSLVTRYEYVRFSYSASAIFA